MTVGVETVRPEASVQSAAEKMRNFNIGFFPICEGKQLVGIVSLDDLAAVDQRLAGKILDRVAKPVHTR